MIKSFTLRMLLTCGSLILACSAEAALLSSFQFNGKGNWSIDAVGSNSTPVGTISADVPVGSTVEKAFLYSTTFLNNNSFVPTVTFEGTIYSGADWTNLGSFTGFNLTGFRTDVTSQVAALIGGGSNSLFNFTVNSESPNNNIDGEVLAIVYSNPSELERTIAFLDGGTEPAGDTTSVNLAEPLTADQLADPDFEALLSLGIGFGQQSVSNNQFSLVDINGTRLTSAAGGEDDGIQNSDGGLITVGGLGDSSDNPADPFAGPTNPRSDDELYDLTPFLSAGDSQIVIDTENPSNNDNIFFAGINITAVAGVNEQPPTVPEPTSIIGLLTFGLFGLSQAVRKESK